MTPTMGLEGRSALITGSTQGIGQGIARAMAAAGATVLYHGLNENEGDAAGRGDAPCIVQNLLADDGPSSLIEQAFALAPGLDTLVCNAGSFFDVPFLEMTPAVWDKTFALNVRAGYFAAQAFARRLVGEGRAGSIIIMGSTNGLQAEPDSTAYDASKGAVVMLTRSLAISLAPHRIRVNCLAPGLIRTPLTQRWLHDRPDAVQHYEKNVPLGRLGEADDCGGAAVFLASPAAAYITGQVLAIDGGLTASQIGPS